MNPNTPLSIGKTIFWQRIAFFTLSVFLVVMWGVFIFYFSEFLRYSNEQSLFRQQIFIVFLFFGVVLAVGSGINYILYQSMTALRDYLCNNSLEDLTIAIRKQQQFWMGLSLLVVFGFVFVVFTVFLGVA